METTLLCSLLQSRISLVPALVLATILPHDTSVTLVTGAHNQRA